MTPLRRKNQYLQNIQTQLYYPTLRRQFCNIVYFTASPFVSVFVCERTTYVIRKYPPLYSLLAVEGDP